MNSEYDGKYDAEYWKRSLISGRDDAIRRREWDRMMLPYPWNVPPSSPLFTGYPAFNYGYGAMALASYYPSTPMRSCDKSEEDNGER